MDSTGSLLRKAQHKIQSIHEQRTDPHGLEKHRVSSASSQALVGSHTKGRVKGPAADSGGTKMGEILVK